MWGDGHGNRKQVTRNEMEIRMKKKRLMKMMIDGWRERRRMKLCKKDRGKRERLVVVAVVKGFDFIKDGFFLKVGVVVK